MTQILKTAKNINMKNFRLILFFVLGIWLIPSVSCGQFTETKEIKKEFKVTPETQIEIFNKYGKVELNTWDKDSVIIEVEIKVEEKKLSKLEKSIDEIEFDFTHNQHFLIAKTLIGQNKSSLGKELLKLKETVLQSDGNMQIDYTVWLPASNELIVENKFGDIFIGDYRGNVKITLSNGNLKSHDFEGKVDLNLSFVDATINTIKTANLNCNFSELYIKKAASLNIISKSSTFEILEIKDLEAESRRDRFRIRLIDMLEAKSSFSNFRLNELTDRLKIIADYGDLDIEKTAVNFSNIYIESRSTDINLYLDEASKFDFEITHIKSELDFCSEIEIRDEKILDEKEKQIKLTGRFGDDSDSITKLNIKANSGEINILSN